MNKHLNNFIINQLPKQYTKMHEVIEVVEVKEHTTVLKVYVFKRKDLEPIIDYVETLNIKQKVRDFNINHLLS